jgi:hypothetical protein
VDGSTVLGDPVTVLADHSKVADLLVISGVSARTEPARGPGQRIGEQVATRAAVDGSLVDLAALLEAEVSV